MKKVIALALFLIILLSGCNNAAYVETDEPENETAAVINIGDCVIIRADFASDALIDAAVGLRGSINEALGTEVKLTNDADMMYGADTVGTPRILVGETSLCPSGSEETYFVAAINKMSGGDHIIMSFEDNTVALAGATDAAVKRAVTEFLSKYVTGTDVLRVDTAAVGTYEGVSGDYTDFTPVMRFIVASDVHFKDSPSVERTRLAEMFDYAYAYADTQSYGAVDAVVFAGDVTDHGYASELNAFREAVEAKLRDETKFICEMGNHEFYGGSQRIFEETMGQSADQHNTVNGFHFITVSTSDGSDYSGKYAWLEDALDEAAADKPDAPVFVFQHHHVKDTVYVSEEWYTTQLDTVFKSYPNIVDFSGHSHGPINNPRSIYQDAYTTLGTGTLSYFEMNSGMSYGTVPPNASLASQFYIVEVDANNRVKLMPFNILTGDFFTCQNSGEPDKQLVYFVAEPSNPDSYTYTRERWSTSAAPYFDADATITPSSVTANGTRVSFTFPQAHDDECVYSYTLNMKDADGAVKSYSVFSDYYIEPLPETVEIPMSGVKAGESYTVTVVAFDCYGAACENPLQIEYTAQ